MTDRRAAAALRITAIEDGVACLCLDVPGQRVNTLSVELLDELRDCLDALESDPQCRAIVVLSGKPDGFIAGAQIDAIAAAPSAQAAQQLALQGQGGMALLEALWRRQGKPVVAAIHGNALGGGLELALACSHRLASDAPSTAFGLPEVRLGLLPGAGGTQRLPRLIGTARALDLILSGRSVRAPTALRWGLVDGIVPAPQLRERAMAFARQQVRGAAAPQRAGFLAWRRQLPRLDGDFWRRLLSEDNRLGQAALFWQVGKQLRRRTRGHYPAPERALQVVRRGLERGLEAGYAAEAQAFGELAMTPHSRALVRLFFATQALKKGNGVSDPAVQPRPVRRLGVLGGGLMGGGIAAVSVRDARLPVHVKELDLEGIGRARAAVQRLADRDRQRGKIAPHAAKRLVAQVTGSTDFADLRGADLVIEAAYEDLGVKRQLLRDFEAACGPEAIFASNTSALSIAAIATAARRPQRVVGMHYFSPVEKMPLLEVVRAPQSADWAVATCVALGRAQNKTVIVVRDAPGFFTTRVLAAYLNEASWLLHAGVAVQAIDAAAQKLGFPVGPCTLLDEIGVDVGLKVATSMHQAFGGRFAPPPNMARLADDQRLGRKVARGFYRYRDGKKGAVDPAVYPVLGVKPQRTPPAAAHLGERLLLSLVNEAARCLEEKVVACPRDGDVGAVMGLGFPPFLGGPFHYVDQQSARLVVQSLERLTQAHGSRLAPAALLQEHAATSARFYPSPAP